MASITVDICDITGEQLTTPGEEHTAYLSVTLPGEAERRVRLHLCGERMDALAAAVGEYISAGEPVRDARPGTPRRVPRRRAHSRNMEIREWATRNGHVIAGRGRLPEHVVAAYDAAHAGQGTE